MARDVEARLGDPGFTPGRRDGVYAVAGEESQTLQADTTPAHFAQALFPGSRNVACSVDAGGATLLHPGSPGETAEDGLGGALVAIAKPVEE